MTLVYVIEDDPMMANVLSLSNRQAGQLQPDGSVAVPRVELFYDAVSAIAAVNEQVPDVIILDILLTGPDGFTFLNELRSYPDTAETPVILISSLDLTNENLSSYGITKILDKSTMIPEDLHTAIAEALAAQAIASLNRQTAASASPAATLAPNEVPEAETIDPTILPNVAPVGLSSPASPESAPIAAPSPSAPAPEPVSPASYSGGLAGLNQLLASSAQFASPAGSKSTPEVSSTQPTDLESTTQSSESTSESPDLTSLDSSSQDGNAL